MLNFKQQRETLRYEPKIVMGVTRFKGDIDNNHIDSCTVLIAAPLNAETGNAQGFGIAKVSFGDSSNFNRFLGIEFPCNLEIAFQTVTSSSGKSKDVMKDFRVPSPVRGEKG